MLEQKSKGNHNGIYRNQTTSVLKEKMYECKLVQAAIVHWGVTMHKDALQDFVFVKIQDMNRV